jgi:hypothetical protein
MKNMRCAVLALALVAVMPAAAQAREPDERSLHTYCHIDDRAKPPAPGQQFEGGAADPAVMAFKPGVYNLDKDRDGAKLYLYDDGSYYLMMGRTGRSATVMRGTEGDDLMAARMLGGCSREQLSEALGRNGLLEPARGMVPVDPARDTRPAPAVLPPKN